jgi:hypothetical protein
MIAGRGVKVNLGKVKSRYTAERKKQGRTFSLVFAYFSHRDISYKFRAFFKLQKPELYSKLQATRICGKNHTYHTYMSLYLRILKNLSRKVVIP